MSAIALLRSTLLLVMALLLGCQPPDAPPLDQQLYIWQRQWTGAHEQALAQSRADFSTLRVLALQRFPQAGWRRAQINPGLLKDDGRPLIVVVRLDGQLAGLDPGDVQAQIQQMIVDWQAQGLTLAGVEIDHDAATARLPAYRELLVGLRQALPAALKLSITALPAWLASPELPALLAAVDSSVLQVHAVSRPERGLFDPVQARQWAERWSRISNRPFYLALPAYGIALLPGDGGAPQVESEVPIERRGVRRELMADPQQLATLASQLRADPPAHLAGLIWFRLPLKGDRRAWSLATLQAVARGEKLQTQLTLNLSSHEGLYDIAVSNTGNLDGPLPARVGLAASGCDGFDGLNGYTVQRTAAGQLMFTRLKDARLPAGSQRSLGWARCTHIDQGASHVSP
ncbi:Protein of unknown function [Pseudomonas sp. ok272]|uniref:DUF3142 domain-containing protein n=1 Tax=unclassified Pseudomonas TaxID=196821 RepID=UPI0008C1B925|nr:MULTISPECIES: DUF3142 domain-containing protein [unclassified Pseudomonas]SEM61674.1 Protein of unknown function [Pseudomonas sp. ok272]SFM48513.1 Protein of unknown function [Pseudomonas sp. ok602]